MIPMRVCFVLTSPFALNAFVAPIIRELLARECQVTVVVNTRAGSLEPDIVARVRVVDIKIVRAISLFTDLLALWKLIRFFQAGRFDVVHSITPKAGLLGMVGARLAGVPMRVHTFTGQVWATRKGVPRWLLREMDKLLAGCATVLLADSPSQRAFLLDEGVTTAARLHVLASGSIAGVDTERFKPHPEWRSRIRRELQVPPDSLLVTYIGRMSREKGVIELCCAFARISFLLPQARLMLVGPDEGALDAALSLPLAVRNRIHLVGLTTHPEHYMAAADIFCLASHREGFGLSLIEAAAAGVPSVASRICGVTDAVVDGVTGLLVSSGDVEALSLALVALAEQPEFRFQLGLNARSRAKKSFSQRQLMDAWLDFYRDHWPNLLKKTGQ